MLLKYGTATSALIASLRDPTLLLSPANPSAANFTYSARQINAIRQILPQSSTGLLANVVKDLSQAAKSALNIQYINRNYPYMGHVQKDLEGLAIAIEKLLPDTRLLLNTTLSIQAGKDVDLGNVFEAIVSASYQSKRSFQKTGRPKSKTAGAVHFGISSALVWDLYGLGKLPKTVTAKSPFYKFVDAAIPTLLRGNSSIPGVVRNSLNIYWQILDVT